MECLIGSERKEEAPFGFSFKEPDFLLFRERRLIRSAVGSRRKRFYGLAVEKIFLLTADAANAFEEFHRECKAAALRIVSERVKERDVGKDISGLQKRQRFIRQKRRLKPIAERRSKILGHGSAGSEFPGEAVVAPKERCRTRIGEVGRIKR